MLKAPRITDSPYWKHYTNMNADVLFVLCYPVPSSLSPRLLDRIEDRGPSSAPPG